MNRDVKQEIKAMQERGWHIIKVCASGHIMMGYKGAGMTTVPSTPSDHRWLKNKRAECKRIERSHAAQNIIPRQSVHQTEACKG